MDPLAALLPVATGDVLACKAARGIEPTKARRIGFMPLACLGCWLVVG